MPISEYIKKQEYIITVHNFDEQDSLYNELTTGGITPVSADILRKVDVVFNRTSSRNTHYFLTKFEVAELQNDPRIKSIELAPHLLGIRPDLFVETDNLESAPSESVTELLSINNQTSSDWNKSNTASSTNKNWALLRCYEGEQRSGWGGTGYEGTGSGTAAVSGTIELTQTGRNVDVVICDENGLVWNHPEFAVNADGSGGTRTVQYNWGQHNAEIGNGSNGTWTYGTGSHSTHVAGTVAGNTQGWARSSNIYNLYYLSGDNFDYTFPWVFDYIRAFHRNKSVNPETGRKNPTIVNNSWGMSIFSNEWSLSDITQVTYRGVVNNASPTGVTYGGFSGVCTSNTKIADLQGLENHGNRITTSGPYTSPGGYILSKPPSWSQTGQQAYLTTFTIPDSSYTVTVDGPAVIDFVNNVAMDTLTGTLSLSSSVSIYNSSNILVTSFNDYAVSQNGGTIENDIRQVYSLPNNETYSIYFTTSYSVGDSPGGDGGGGGGDGGGGDGGGGDGGGGGFSIDPNFDITWAVAMSLIASEVEPSGPTATVTTITNSFSSTTGLTSSTTPTSGNNDDGYWTIDLPFSISYFGNSYSTIYVGTNHYLTFGSGSAIYSGIGASSPNIPKICWCAADNSVQRIYHGVTGSTGNRIYTIRLEGNAATSGTLGSPNMLCEYKFYELISNQIDLQVGQNNRKTTSGGGFSTAQLNSWGFISGQRIPARVSSMDADIEDAISEGIIMVGAAGNGRWKHDVPGGPDWDNSFQMANRYPGQTFYYMRGTSPTANDQAINGGFEIPNICVGSIDSTSVDQKVLYSDCGPGVDIWAPGTAIISALPSGVADPRNGSYYLGKYNGTSMASPQVCGVLACALETYPYWNQTQAKAYIQGIAKSNQLTATSSGPTDGQDLQGAPNLTLFYKKERLTTGQTFPRITHSVRPASGALFPRTRIRRTN